MVTKQGWYRMRNGNTVFVDGIDDSEAWSHWYPKAVWNAKTGKHDHACFDIVGPR
jgi:hypothetical protein